MIDLTTKPFNLSQNEIDYVLEQVKQMTTSEKIGQLFFVIGQDEKMVDLDEFIDALAAKERADMLMELSEGTR